MTRKALGFKKPLLTRADLSGYAALEELALNLRFSWNHKGDEIWRTLDAELWERTRNPWVVLQTASREKFEQLLKDPAFSQKVNELIKLEQDHAEADAWFQIKHPKPSFKNVAYFSMEYMLSESLPIYSGGLGNVAGDQLKTASDLGIPVVAVGLLYQQGYFRQVIDKEGRQEALFPYNSPIELPITAVREANGEWLRILLDFPGFPIWLRVWQAEVGRLKLYLLDSNDPANFPAHRGITGELYGEGSELRLKQEIILGIGGYRLLRQLGINPEVCHLNEGHAAFAVLERARMFMEENHQPFDVALTATRAGNLFTTHTAVAAAFDLFSPSLIEHYFYKYCTENLKISLHDLLALGRKNRDDTYESFNMAYLAIHGSGAINGVSELHGKVSRHLFSSLFPRFPENEVPIGYVTNGVHMPSWDSKDADALWTEFCGKERWLGMVEELEKDFRKVSDEKLWQMRTNARKELIAYARKQLSRQFAIIGEAKEEVERAKGIFNENRLTIGFARRFAPYKRPNLLLHDPERLVRILKNSELPVQLLIAGKAHPADQLGQQLIHQWIEFMKRPEVRDHIIFLSDYDMLLSEHLVAGVDVWINTPRRPWEACGTSGMKVLVNGGINLSELDGWWAEAYAPDVGWALGDGQEHGEDPAWDAQEAETLYTLLEKEVIPEFYHRNGAGFPRNWLKKIRESMALLTPRFSACRTVCEYTEKYYLPAASRYFERESNQCAQSKELVAWQNQLKQEWPQIKFLNTKVESKGDRFAYEAELYLSKLDPKKIKVEVYAEGSSLNELKYIRSIAEKPGVHLYNGNAPANRQQSDYTLRAMPYLPKGALALETPFILWQH
jgi:glycogen phosphorylase